MLRSTQPEHCLLLPSAKYLKTVYFIFEKYNLNHLKGEKNCGYRFLRERKDQDFQQEFVCVCVCVK